MSDTFTDGSRWQAHSIIVPDTDFPINEQHMDIANCKIAFRFIQIPGLKKSNRFDYNMWQEVVDWEVNDLSPNPLHSIR